MSGKNKKSTLTGCEAQTEPAPPGDITDCKPAEKAMRRQNEYLTALHETLLDVASQLDLDRLLENILKRAAQLMGTSTGFLDMLEPGDDHLTPKFALGVLAEESVKFKNKPGEGLGGKVWQTGQTILVEDYDAWPGRIESHQKSLIRSIVAAPLMSKSGFVGVLGLAHERRSGRTFGPEAVRQLDQFARFAAIAIENARLYSAVQHELTRRKEAEEVLRRSREEFKDLFDNAPVGYHELDAEGRIFRINNTELKMLGYSAGELIGQFVWKISTDEKLTHRIVMAKLAGDMPPSEGFERVFRRKDGSTFPVLIVDRLVKREDGAVIGIHGTVQDITERKRAEEAVKENEERLRLAMAGANQGFYDLNLQTGAATVSPEYARMLDYEPGGMTFNADWWHQHLHPDDQEMANRILGECQQGTRTDYRMEYCLQTKNGGWRWILSLGKVMECDAQGRPLRMLGTHTDVTEPKKAEEALNQERKLLRTLIDNIPDYFFVRDISNRFILANESLARLMGVAGPSDLLGKRDADFYPPELAASWDKLDQEIFAGNSVISRERVIRFPNGQELTVLNTKIPFRNDKGEVIGMIGIGRDITERKRAEDEIKTILRTTMDGFYLIGLDGQFLETNDAYCRLIGYSREELLKMGIKDVEAIETNKDIKKRIQQIWDAGYLRFETKHRRKDGRIITVEASVTAAKDGKGKFVCFVRDITERKRSEEETRRRAALLEAQLNSTLDGIIIVDEKGNKIVQNQRCVELWKLPQHVVDNCDDKQQVEFVKNRAKDPEKFAEKVAYLYAHPNEISRDEIDFKDGMILDRYSAPVVGKDGTCFGRIWVFRDITERKQSEERVADALKFNLNILRASPAGILVYKASGPCISANEAAAAIIGSTKEQLLQQNFRQLESWKHSGLLKAAEAALAEGTEQKLEANLTSTFGKQSWLNCRFAPFQYASEPHLFLIMTDITERKLADQFQARLATAVEQAAETIVITDTSGTILYANPAFEKTSGYPREEVLGQNPRLLKSGKQDNDFYRQMWETIGRGEIWSGHIINRCKDGRLYEEEATISPVRDSAGAIVNYVAVKRDVTRERQLETQMHQAQKMEAIGQLAGGVAHDFNNILGVIIGYSDLLALDLATDSPMRNHVEEIQAAAARASGLTRQLLLFSRKQTVEPVVLDLNEAVKDLDKMLRRLIGENIEMTVTPGKDIGHIRADPGHIGQVLMNLAVNARDAMPDGGKLTIATRNVTLDETRARAGDRLTPGNYVMLSVSDSGIGMTPEVQARLFEPLFTTKPAGKGTGLGLATCQTIVQQSGGCIDVESEPGQGATFKIYFPQNEKPLETAVQPAQKRPLPRGKETLLLVEDEPFVRHLAAGVLEAQGYTVLRANNGQEALNLVQSHKDLPIHLVVTDVVMPRMGGKIMVEWLKATNPGLKVLFTSGYTDETIADEGVLGPGAAFLAKPYSPETLARKVRAILDNDESFKSQDSNFQPKKLKTENLKLKSPNNSSSPGCKGNP